MDDHVRNHFLHPRLLDDDTYRLAPSTAQTTLNQRASDKSARFKHAKTIMQVIINIINSGAMLLPTTKTRYSCVAFTRSGICSGEFHQLRRMISVIGANILVSDCFTGHAQLPATQDGRALAAIDMLVIYTPQNVIRSVS